MEKVIFSDFCEMFEQTSRKINIRGLHNEKIIVHVHKKSSISDLKLLICTKTQFHLPLKLIYKGLEQSDYINVDFLNPNDEDFFIILQQSRSVPIPTKNRSETHSKYAFVKPVTSIAFQN